jgi:hypothetical protein
MPVYNVAAYVGMAVCSVLEQSLTDFELIIADDGGTDESVAACPNLLWREPVKALTTLAACVFLRLVPPGGFSMILKLAKPTLAGG